MFILILSLIYFILIVALDYWAIFVFGASWHLSLSSKLILIFLSCGAAGVLIGATGLLKAKKWARRLILIITALNLVYSAYPLFRAAQDLPEALEYANMRTNAIMECLYCVIFIWFNIVLAVLAYRKNKAECDTISTKERI